MKASNGNQDNHLFEFGPFRLDSAERQLLRDGEPVTIPPKAFDTLVVLVENRGHAVRKDELIKSVWPDTFVEENNLTQYVSLLRKALGENGGKGYIETVPRWGYRFVGDVRLADVEAAEVTVHRTTRASVEIREEMGDDPRPALGQRAALLVSVCAVLVAVVAIAYAWAAGGPPQSRRMTDNERAYEAYMRGRYLWSRRTTESTRASIEQFKRAIDEDPNFALAWVGLADAYAIEAAPLAEPALRRALEIDDTIGEAHASLGFYRLFHHWDVPMAESELRLAVELSPRYATAHQWYALCLGVQGRFDAAKAEMAAAIECDPVSPNMRADMAQICIFAGDYDEAITHCRAALELDPNFLFAHQNLFAAYRAKGMHEEAVAAYLESAEAVKESPAVVAALREAYATSGWQGFVRALMPAGRSNASFMAGCYVELGDRERAIEQLEKAYAGRDFFLIFVAVDPLYAPLRSDPRFVEIARRVGVVS
jgi:DNA-binding winged helix-turn-helix (wHTH) protein/tetratricopeptide (TPR) repeat protein